MIYVLYGEEHYLIQKQLKCIIESNITFEKEMNSAYFDATKNTLEEIIADAYTVPFFSNRRVVVVNHALFLSASAVGNQDLSLLENYLDNPNETTILVMICESEKLDQRKKIVKRLLKEAEVLKFSPFDDHERAVFLKKESEKRNLKFSSAALNEFYHRVGYSPERILNELDKLALYDSKIEVEDVKVLISRPLDENVFDLFIMLVQKKFAKAYQLWCDFNAQNIEVIALIAMLASQYRFLYQVDILRRSGLNKKEIAEELKAHPYRVEKTLSLCHLCNAKEAMNALHDLSILDQKIKKGKIDKKLGLELFLIMKGN